MRERSDPAGKHTFLQCELGSDVTLALPPPAVDRCRPALEYLALRSGPSTAPPPRPRIRVGGWVGGGVGGGVKVLASAGGGLASAGLP